MKTYPLWWDSVASGPPFDQPPPDRADVAIVGAGYTGLAAARALARRGARVVVLERERVGSGASSRNGGQVLAGLKPEPHALVAMAGETRARELFRASVEAIAALEGLIAEERIECGYERVGHVLAASKPSHFDAFRAEQELLARLFGHHVRLVPRKEQASELGSDAYHGLLVDERSGGLNPAAYVDGLARAACRAGAILVERAAVTGVVRQASGWRVETARGALQAGELLIATNGYTGPVVPALQRRLIPIGSYVIATEPLGRELRALLPTRRMAFDSKHFLHYFRLTADDRLLFGGRAIFGRATPAATARSIEILRRDLAAIFPSLEGVRIDYGWSGLVAYTRDQLPHAGRLHGVWYAAGYCGHGVAMATALGSAIASRIAGDRADHPLVDDGLQPVPLYRGRPWFLPIVALYFRWKDLIE